MTRTPPPDDAELDYEDNEGADDGGLLGPAHGPVAVFHAPQPARGGRAASGGPGRADIDSPFLDLVGGVVPERAPARTNGHAPGTAPRAPAPRTPSARPSATGRPGTGSPAPGSPAPGASATRSSAAGASAARPSAAGASAPPEKKLLRDAGRPAGVPQPRLPQESRAPGSPAPNAPTSGGPASSGASLRGRPSRGDGRPGAVPPGPPGEAESRRPAERKRRGSHARGARATAPLPTPAPKHKDRDPSIELAITEIAGHLTFSPNTVTAWYWLPEVRWAFRPDPEREAVLSAISEQYAGLAGFRLHLRRTTRPFPADEWARTVDGNTSHPLPAVP
ncbi:MAG TPA: hypothetical protein VFM54_14340, partial [Micromonosporaceae bacterium]|nr:hypothetical protein [Micromonosporaceae bacterium]